MMNKRESPAMDAKLTEVDLALAKAYFPILVEMAKARETLTYSQLVERAKAIYPQNEIVQSAIPVSTGRRLDVVRAFTRELGRPDLSSLVVSKGSGECGSGFTRNFNPKAVREDVFGSDWSSLETNFEGFVSAVADKIKPKKRVKPEEARKLMSDYYQANKAQLPPEIKEFREYIIEMISEGVSACDAFSDCLSRLTK